jgi:hypothetical protein
MPAWQHKKVRDVCSAANFGISRGGLRMIATDLPNLKRYNQRATSTGTYPIHSPFSILIFGYALNLFPFVPLWNLYRFGHLAFPYTPTLKWG